MSYQDRKEYFYQSRNIPGILCAVAVCMFFLFVNSGMAKENGIESLRKTGKAFASIAKRVSPAVVLIQVEKILEREPAGGSFSPFGNGNSPFDDDFFRRFFGQPFPKSPESRRRRFPQQKRQVVGQGSGFIISADGYIMTNNHVVGDADKVTVKLEDGREFTAKIIGADPHSDVAVIKIEAKDLPVLPLGDSDALEVGEWVVAVGNPFGLSHTITAGIVSAKGRSSIGINDYENFIQTDAAINPGNSGGPLVNLNGQAVGMNTAIFSRSGGYMGVGFAIPINMAKSIKDQLVKKGFVVRGYLGIVIQELTTDLAKTFGLDNQQGVLVAQITKDSPAENAGLKQGDIIVELDGKPIENVGSLRNQVALKAPGTKVKVSVLRNGKQETITITIGKLPESGQMAAVSPHVLDNLGLTVKTLTNDIAEQLGYQGEKGAVVTEVKSGSVAEMAGIRPGALIKEVNRKRIQSADEFERVVEQTPKHGTVLILIREGGFSRYVALQMK